MSLIQCSECGGTVSDKAVACPHCGAPVEVSIVSPVEIPDEPIAFNDIPFKKENPVGKEKSNRYKPLLIKAISDYEKSIATIIFLCIHDLDFGLGFHKITQILTGQQTKFITDYELQYNPAFSLLKQYSRNDVKAVIEVLEITGYIKREDIGWNRNVLSLTDKAYDFLDGREDYEGSFIDVLTNTDFIVLDEEQTELYEELRNKRYTIARDNDIPAFTVCKDKSLRWMAVKCPENEAELLSIKGIGDAFVEKYGKVFIQVIKTFKKQKQTS